MPAPVRLPARHPIRRALAPVAQPRRPHRSDSDLKLFLLSFAAFSVCFYTMIF